MTFAEHLFIYGLIMLQINISLYCITETPICLIPGHTMRLPVKLESRTSSMLLVSWVENRPAVSISHTVTLYHTELGSYDTLSMDTTTNNNYRFTALDSCSPYVACVEAAGTHSFTCVSTITGMDWWLNWLADIHKWRAAKKQPDYKNQTSF